MTPRLLRTGRQPRSRAATRTGILVAGMHRSGTSALARVLTLAGCDLPQTLVEAKPDNVAGFWESPRVVELNDAILASAGSCWDDWRPLERGWHASPAAGPFRERAVEVLRQEYGESGLFVLKDPRICRLLPFWIDALAGLDLRPCVVAPIRSPLDVAASLEARNGIDPFVAYLIWLRHVLDAEADSRRLPRAHVRYDVLLSDAPAALDRIGGGLGLALPRRDAPETAAAIDAFLSRDLRHHRSGDDTLLADEDIPAWVRSTFRILERWTRGEVDEADTGELDRIRAAFDAAAPAFGRALAAGQEAGRECRRLARELLNVSETLETTREAFRERDRRLDEQNQRLAGNWKKLEAARHTLTERNRQLATARQQLAATRQELAASRKEIAAVGTELEAARATAAGQSARIAELAADLDAARRRHLMALARRGLDALEVLVRPTPEWLAEARGRGPGPALELRRNGRLLARPALPDGAGDTLRIPIARSRRGVAGALYSVHDAATGAVLAGLAAPSLWRARAVEGAVETRPRPEIRGWLLDAAHPGRRRRVAIEVDGRLCDVITAGEPRGDIARWKGTDGRHGFAWPVPAPAAEGTRVDVFDAASGRPLRGSPVRVEGGQATAAGTDEA